MLARKPRLHIPGGLYHVIVRGNGYKIGEELNHHVPSRP